jgi:hypothetical protein
VLHQNYLLLHVENVLFFQVLGNLVLGLSLSLFLLHFVAAL